MGNTIGAHILLQIIGRALRIDYVGKEGWGVIVRPSEEGTTEDEVMESIIMQIMEFIGNDSTSFGQSQIKIRQVVTQFFGEMDIGGKVYDIEETVGRIQAMFVRKEFDRSALPKEKYKVIRQLNADMGVASKMDYEAKRAEHVKYIDDPKSYFKDAWVSWYHFLGIDTSAFPPTKDEWIRVCRDQGITTWTQYKNKHNGLLPTNPSEMYDEYTNWEQEFGITDDYDW
jgi:hypothetical protein